MTETLEKKVVEEEKNAECSLFETHLFNEVYETITESESELLPIIQKGLLEFLSKKFPDRAIPEDVVLPNHFVVKLPYSKGRREVLYEVPVELMYLNNGSGRVEILFQISELEQIEETALQDEVDFLKQGLAEFKELLVLLNY